MASPSSIGRTCSLCLREKASSFRVRSAARFAAASISSM